MKYKFLDRSFEPLFKHGIGLGTAALIGGISAGVGAIGSGIAGYAASNNALSANSAENEKNRKFNSKEADKARDWQAQQWNVQFDKQTQEWYNQIDALQKQWESQFNTQSAEWYNQQDYTNQQAYNYWLKQQEYNSPSNMVGRLNSAGLNAAAAINAQQFGSTGLSAAPVSVPSPSVAGQVGVPSPSVGGSPMASVPFNNVAQPSNGAQAFSQIAGGLADIVKSFAGASKDSSIAAQNYETLQTYIQQKFADLASTELLNQYQEIRNYVVTNTKDAQVRKFGLDLDKTVTEIMLNSENASYFAEQSASERLNQILLDYSGKLKQQDFLQAVMTTQRFGELLDNKINLGLEQIKTEKTVQASNLASAYEHTEAARLHVDQQAFTKMETDLTSLKKVAQILENGIKSNEFSASSLGLELQEAKQLFKLIEEADKLDDIRNNWNLWNKIRKVKNLLGFDMSVGASVHN